MECTRELQANYHNVAEIGESYIRSNRVKQAPKRRSKRVAEDRCLLNTGNFSHFSNLMDPKTWPLNRGHCLIQVVFKTCLSVVKVAVPAEMVDS